MSNKLLIVGASLVWFACNPKSEQAIAKTVEESAKVACQQFADEKKVTDFCNKAEEVQPFVDAILAAREKARSMVKADAGAAPAPSASASPPDAGKHG